jgi:hypothetical protein
LAIPTIIITAGITWAITIKAQKPRKDQTRRPLLSLYVGAANAGAAEVSEMRSPKPLAVPVGENWQVTEEAPKLTNGQERLTFQTEQSLQPVGATTAPPEDNRKVVPR